MKVLVIPDVHLKPWMFRRASELIKANEADRAVCLMDIADDWRQQFNLDLYMQTYDAALEFAKMYPDTLWCFGNHDLSYVWQRKVTGHSPIAARTICEKMQHLRGSLPDEKQIAYLHRIDNVLFSHAGLLHKFVRRYVPAEQYDNIDAVIGTVNGFGVEEMWSDLSPLWCRPQYDGGRLYKQEELLQVAGHTPVPFLALHDGLLSCDVFSTDRNREPIGTCAFPIIDTITKEFRGIK